MKKRIVSLALAATMTVACMTPLLAGCGDETTDYEHTILFYSSQGKDLQEKTVEAINSFQAKYPGWKVEHTTHGGYDDVKDKISADLQGQGGGLQPDVAYCYPDHVAQYLQTEQVININNLINSTDKVKGVDTNPDSETYNQEIEYTVGYSKDDLADFTKSFWEEGTATNYSGYEKYHYPADAMLSLPFVKSTEVLYYNEKVLKELNLTPAKTWTEMWEQAAKIKANSKYKAATVLGYDSEANWFINMCKQNGWGYTDIDENNHFLFNKDNGPLKEWLGTLKNYYSADYGYITTQNTYGSYTSALFVSGPEEGGIVYCVGSSGGASHQKPKPNTFTAGVTSIPGSVQADGTVNSSVISQGPSLVMFNAGHGVSNADEKAKMTFLFIKELLDPVFQASFSKISGYNPCRESAYELKSYQDFLETSDEDIIAAACKAAMESRKDFFVSPAFVGSSTARTQVGNVIQYVMKGQRTPEVALNMAYKNCGGK
ncbi:MAG: extracellular solute-binding protein [Clostridia bacterium]|nr:extracellular solute-binding protein [Clostridia bacterium]